MRALLPGRSAAVGEINTWQEPLPRPFWTDAKGQRGAGKSELGQLTVQDEAMLLLDDHFQGEVVYSSATRHAFTVSAAPRKRQRTAGACG
jgi:hypothetical protein